jgi:hypothetical protein
MVDLLKGQTAWTAFYREFMTYLAPRRTVDTFRKRFAEELIVILEQFEQPARLTNWTFVGAVKGVNCTEDGRLFVNLNDETPGALQAQVQVYKDSAKGAPDLVAQGDSGDNTTITLVEQNNSGLTGTVDLGVPVASDTDIILALQLDEQLKEVVFPTTLKGTVTKRRFVDRIDSIRGTLLGIVNAHKGDTESGFIKNRMAEFFGSSNTGILSYAETVDDNGDAVITPSGLLEELDDNMNDESVPGPQTILQNTITPGTPVFDADNQGQGTLTVNSTKAHAKNGDIDIKCITGIGTDVLEEVFEVRSRQADGTTRKTRLNATIRKAFESGFLGVRFTIARTITDVEPVGPNQTDAWTFAGESSANTDTTTTPLNAKLYVELTDVAGTRQIKIFSDAAKLLVVALGTRVGDGTLTFVEQNGSGLSGTVLIAYTANDLAIVVSLNPFDVDDKITLAIVNNRAGKIQSLVGDIWDFSLNQGGSPTLPDSLLKEGVDHILDQS